MDALPDHLTRKEINVRAFKSAIIYAQRSLGADATRELCQATGLPLQYLIDENNWVSLEWLNLFYETLVQHTDNPEAPYESGLLSVDPEVWGSLYVIFRTIASPSFVYKQVCELTPNFNKQARFTVLKLGRDMAELAYRHPGENRHVCHNRRGQLAAVPQVWGLPTAQVEELACQHDGAERCHYRITWTNRPRNLPAVIAAGAVMAVTWLLGAYVGAEPLVALVSLGAAFGFVAGKALDLTRTNRENLHYAELQSAKLEESVRDVERRYDEIQRAKLEIEDLNVNLEHKVEERTAELAQAHTQLELSYKKLQELDRVKSQFFSNITHELRTPLTLILAPIESILEGETGDFSENQRTYLNPIRRNALKLLKLINDLLDLARIEEHFMRIRVEPTDMAALLTEIAEHATPLAARKKIDLELEIQPDCVPIYADAEKIERAVINLVSNALKFTDDGGRVVLKLEHGEGEVVVAVQDNGIGIPAKLMDRIFKRFSQADGSVTRRFGGTGIGLALSRELVEIHGGELKAHSTEHEGSRFEIHLKPGQEHFDPKVLDRRKKTDHFDDLRRVEDRGPVEWTQQLLELKDYRFLDIEEVTERRLATREQAASRATKVLVVEDNLEVLRFIHQQLRDEHMVYLGRDGVHGLELARREKPDVIVTDYMMPEMDGLTLLRELRSDTTTSDIPVIMLTAKSRIDDRMEVREAGADIYMNKPFSPRELRTAVRQLLERQGRQADVFMREHVRNLEVISAGLAHEIHNPLSYIKNGFVVISEKVDSIARTLGRDDLETAERTQRIQTSLDRMNRMREISRRGIERIEQVVQLVRRYAREGYPEEPTPIKMDDAIRDVGELISTTVDKQVHVDLDLQAGDARVSCIPEEMHQVIRNLWQNALDAVGADGRVRVATRREQEDGVMVLEVEDDGPGIPRENLRRIFTPFFTSKEPGKGMGLGLAISQQVVTRAGGAIAVKSSPGEGTAFRVRLPMVGAPVE